MSNARDKANIPALNFSSTGIDDNADATAITIDSSERVGLNTTTPGAKLEINSTGSYYNTANQHQQWSYNGTPFLSLYMDAYASPYFDTDSASSWNPGATMVFKRQGSEKMRIDSSGNVGIGTTSPSRALSVVGASNAYANFDATNYESFTIGSDANGFLIYSEDAAAYRFNINSSGNVGIGTLSPSANLEVRGASSNGQIYLGGSTTATYGKLYSDNDGTLIASADGGNNASSSSFRVEVDASERMRITSDGFLGIGTTAPGSPLTVSHTNSTVAFLNNTVSATTDLQNILLLQSNTSGSAGVGFGVNLAFNGERNDGNTQRFGNFGFSANTNSGTSLKTDCVISLYSGHEVLRLKQTSVGSQNEMIAPDLLTTGTTSNRYPLYWVHNGTIGSIQPFSGSVREMKTDINDMSSVDWIHSLKPRSFKFRDFETNEDGSKTYLETTNNEPSTEYGLIAEEVNEVSGSDYILDKDENNNVKGVLYHNLVPVLLKAVQEQKNTIQELEARITTLETTTP